MWTSTALYLALLAGGLLAWTIMLRVSAPAKGEVGDPIVTRAGQRRLFRGLPAALANGEIYLVYQPKLRLRTSEVDGVEALVRWEHPTLGTISRKSLIPLAEKRGHIHELTVWVLRQAIADQLRLSAAGQQIQVSINVSASLLTDETFVRDVCTLVGPHPGAIGLEITETAFIESSPTALTNLERMIGHGVSISIDDYGSGLSSLAYLKELPARELKIDKMFVSGMTMSHRDPLIVRSTIDLAHALDLTVVAEGVESLAALALLRVMGCDYAQGFLISPALPVADLISYLESGRYRSLLSDASASVTPPMAFWARVGREDHQPPEATDGPQIAAAS